jgi:hypothetical protein
MIKLKNILNEAKVIKVKFSDNDQTLYFSDGEKSKVDYDGEFKYKGKWFDTSDMNSSKDLEKMLSKAFPGTKFIQTESVNESTPDQVIKDLDKAKNDLLKKVDALIAKKKKLYSDVDIEAPMSADEKKLDKDIADLFSQINKLVLQKRSVKKESVNESLNINSLKKIHDAIFKLLKTKKGVGEVKEFSEFPNRYGDDVSTFSVKYNIEDKYNYDLQEIKIEYSTSRVFIPNKGYFPFRTFNDIKNIINKKSSLKESVNEVKTYKRGDKLKIKLPNGKQFDVVFVDYSNTKGIAYGKFKIDGEVVTKPFSLSSVKESVNEEKVYIDYLNKAKGFKQDRIKFNSYEDAVKWARKNFDKFSPDMIKYESVNEENEPTNPELWDKAIAAAKRKYDVYPSAYANAFASKWYKEKGGDWKTKKESVNESAKSEKLASLINNVIDKVDSSLSYKDFAMAVGKILKDEYGSHLYSSFVQELNKELKKENESIKLTSIMTSESKDSIREALTISIRNLIDDLVPRDIQNATTPQQMERRTSFIRDLVKTLNYFYKQNRIDWRFADSNIKFKMYSKD